MLIVTRSWVDYDKRNDQCTGKPPFCNLARAKAADLQVPSLIRHKIGIGEPRNLTDDRDERDQMDEQSKDRNRGGQARRRRQFREARRPPARLHRNIGKPSHDIFDGENRREDAEEWGYQRRADRGKRKHQADDADAQPRRIGREAKDAAISFYDAGEQGECGGDGDADTQWLHDSSLASLARRRHGIESLPFHGDRILRIKP